jgi:hypothetical protein
VISRRVLSIGLLSDPNVDCIKMLCPWEVDVPIYHIRVHKNDGISYTKLMFRLHHSQMHDLGPFHYCTPS